MSEPPIDPPVEEEPPIILGWDEAEVTGDRINVFDAPIIAGDPDGARIEIKSTGFHAFNGAGLETARIDGTEGVFVGGEFRTSDSLPGQVVLSDTAVTLDGVTVPGISVEPSNAVGYTEMPSIAPADEGMVISGGRDTAGAQSFVRMNPVRAEVSYVRGALKSVIRANENSARIQTYTGDASGAVLATTGRALIYATDPTGYVVSHASADASEASLHTKAGGSNRYLTVDADGVWVKTFTGGVWKYYNLEETAQDSGWQSFPTAPGVTGSASLAWRNKGGIIWFRGTVTADWTTGSLNTIAENLPAEIRPVYATYANEAGSRDPGVTFRMDVAGKLTVDVPANRPDTMYRMSALTYPIG